MPVLKLTDLRVKALSTEKAQEDFFDAVLPTFGVRVSSLGAKSFFVMYRQWGRKHRRTLGRYPKLGLSDARDLARDVMEKVESGADPGANGRQALTFGELANSYLELYAKIQKKSWREDHRMLAKDLLPRWEGRPVRTIRRADVVELLDDVALRGPIIANRTRALVSKIFSWGMSRDMVEANPAHGSPVPGKSRSRDRVLTPEEIRAIWQAVEAAGSRTSATLQASTSDRTARNGSDVDALERHRRAVVDGSRREIEERAGQQGVPRVDGTEADQRSSPTAARTYFRPPAAGKAISRTPTKCSSGSVKPAAWSFGATTFGARPQRTWRNSASLAS